MKLQEELLALLEKHGFINSKAGFDRIIIYIEKNKPLEIDVRTYACD